MEGMTEMAEKAAEKKKARGVVWWVVILVLLALLVAAILNRNHLVDWYHAVRYTPTAAMAEIQEKLALTDRGEFVFKAAEPVLAAAEEFNQNCRQEASETAVLGCLAGGKIYVYDISEEELSGIREATAAHELLHAVWARLSAEKKAELLEALEGVLLDNGEILGDELATYEAADRDEELYVRAGTEIRDLSRELEEHYGEIFENRGQVVGFYEGYNGVFKGRQMEAERLEGEIESLKTQIEAKISEFKAEAEQLDADITEFNNCAAVSGCFAGVGEFASLRAELIERQQALGAENEEINGLISEYNAKIDQYNQNAVENQRLQQMVNSNKVPEIGNF